VAYELDDIKVKGAWSGPARLQLHAHVNAPVADLPVRQALGGRRSDTSLWARAARLPVAIAHRNPA
jgi:acetoacetate decarboxylase